jgi:hypothetical protein
VNKYLEEVYGQDCQIELLNVLIEKKTKWVCSVGGKGTQRTIDALNAIKTEVKAMGSLDIGDKLMGVR